MNEPSISSIDSGLQISNGGSAAVQLISADEKLRSEWIALLKAMGYTVVRDDRAATRGGDGAEVPIDVIVLLTPAEENAAVGLIEQFAKGEHTPPVVVFGAASGIKWPKRALQAGAFGYLHLDAPVQEQAGLLAGAVQLRQMQLKVQLLIEESERLCASLVETYGQNSDKLQHTLQEARKAQEALRGMQAKIVKAFFT